MMYNMAFLNVKTDMWFASSILSKENYSDYKN